MILPSPVSRFQSGDSGQTWFPTKVENFVLRANLRGKSASALPPDLYKCGGGAQTPFFAGGVIPAFARCCLCIAANLLVFTSPMTSSFITPLVAQSLRSLSLIAICDGESRC